MALFSNNLKVTDFQLSSNEPRYSNRSWTGTQITRSTGIQYYQINFTLNFNKKDIQEYQNFIAKYGQGAPFNMDLGHLSIYKGSQNVAVAATAPAAKGVYQITCNSNQLEVGTLIQFQNHKKIYRVIANNGTTLSIFPNLRSNVAIGENVKFTNIEGSFTLDVDNDYKLNVQNVMNITFKASEDI
ncbi:hypothetical protein IAQ00_13645 [Pantoea ananatis]|uniref:hypothetical protein n=1 Tax=Pantoea ananas TaxID=553 RepID=UPI002079BB24|nr:hypothetical protein [Pantoea ananatis]USL56757.1 hypothetical protein IAQ00_13645 [Pantoea ananatis]